ncbi:hypothetical protein NPIL_79931, partial [Nephila pilipes]
LSHVMSENPNFVGGCRRWNRNPESFSQKRIASGSGGGITLQSAVTS